MPHLRLIHKISYQYSGLLVYKGLIYADLNFRWFENFLVISFVFPGISGKFYTARPLPRKVSAQRYWTCIHGNAAFGYILYTYSHSLYSNLHIKAVFVYNNIVP
jgi:hypothetical protein